MSDSFRTSFLVHKKKKNPKIFEFESGQVHFLNLSLNERHLRQGTQPEINKTYRVYSINGAKGGLLPAVFPLSMGSNFLEGKANSIRLFYKSYLSDLKTTVFKILLLQSKDVPHLRLPNAHFLNVVIS